MMKKKNTVKYFQSVFFFLSFFEIYFFLFFNVYYVDIKFRHLEWVFDMQLSENDGRDLICHLSV